MYWKLRPPRTSRFASALILHPSALEIALGLRPRAISRASGCKINTSANLSVLGGRNFQYIPPLVSVILHYELVLNLYRLKNCGLGFKHEQWAILTVLQTKQGTKWCFAVNRLCLKLSMGAMFMSIIRRLYAITGCPDVTNPSHILPGAFMGDPKTPCRIILTWNVFSIVFKI